jgi:hypothetical protein
MPAILQQNVAGFKRTAWPRGGGGGGKKAAAALEFRPD